MRQMASAFLALLAVGSLSTEVLAQAQRIDIPSDDPNYSPISTNSTQVTAAYGSVLVSVTPSNATGVLVLHPGEIVNCTAVFQNIGTNDWSTDPANPGYVELRSVDATHVTTVVSPLAFNWLSGSGITAARSETNVTSDFTKMTSVKLKWTAPGDDSIAGQASMYDVRYAPSQQALLSWTSASRFTTAQVPSLPGQTDSVRVTGLQPATTYWFGMKTGDEIPNWALISNQVMYTTGTNLGSFLFSLKAPAVAGRYVLNLVPYNPSTATYLSLSVATITVDVTREVTGSQFTAFTGDFNGDHQADLGIWERTRQEFSVANAMVGSSHFQPTADAWLIWPDAANADSLLTADFSGDNYTDLCIHKPNGDWSVAYNQGGYFQVTNGPWISNFGNQPGDVPLCADFNGDGRPDAGYGRQVAPNVVEVFVALNNGSGRFIYTAGPEADGAWIRWALPVSGSFQFLTGQFSEDRYSDLAVRERSRGEWFYAYNWGGKFQGASGPAQDGSWLNAWAGDNNGLSWQTFVGKSTNDIYDDIIVRTPQLGRAFVAKNMRGSLAPLGGIWMDNWAQEDGNHWQVLSADVSGDQYVDFIAFSPVYGRAFVAYNWGSSFVGSSGPAPNGAWIDGFGRVTGGAAMMSSQSSLTETREAIPATYGLNALGPQPFHGQTEFAFSLPADGQLNVLVYDISGRQVATIVDTWMPAGVHRMSWKPDGNLSAGVYFVRMTVNAFTATRKSIFLGR